VVSGYVAPAGDVDWYRFELTATMRVRVKLYDLPADFDVYVFDGTGQFLWASTWGRRLPEEVVVQVPAGVYYVQLIGYAGGWSGEAPYRLLAERVEQ
jgi:Bacterial pre-peptidase C-terminal domain